MEKTFLMIFETMKYPHYPSCYSWQPSLTCKNTRALPHYVPIKYAQQQRDKRESRKYHFLIKGGFATMIHTQSSELFATDDWDNMVAQSNKSQSVKQISQPEPESLSSDKSLSESKNSLSESRSKKKLKRPKGITKKTFDEIEYLDQQIALYSNSTIVSLEAGIN